MGRTAGYTRLHGDGSLRFTARVGTLQPVCAGRYMVNRAVPNLCPLTAALLVFPTVLVVRFICPVWQGTAFGTGVGVACGTMCACVLLALLRACSTEPGAVTGAP